MKNELAKTENRALAENNKVTDQELIMHLENIGLLKNLTPGEKNTYLQIAKAFNLNPFKREIHVSKYGDQMSIITGYEVYIKRAERTGMLDGWGVTTSGSVATKDLKATVTIHRKDRTHPFVWEADYNEYVQYNNKGQVTKFWQKANTMIKKVAISQGFRLCFSDELGGMPYTRDEMPETEDINHEEVSTEGKGNTAQTRQEAATPVTPVTPVATSQKNDSPKTREQEAEEKPFVIPANWHARMDMCKTKADVLEVYKKYKETVDAHPELQQLLKETQNSLSNLKTA